MKSRYEVIQEWFTGPIASVMSSDEAIESFHRQHPSKVFLRNLPVASSVLDVGAGEGGLSIFKKWPSPARPDLKLFAFSLEKGRKFDDFDGYELGNWNLSKPSFGGMKFNAIHCANFIEHIDDPESLIEWSASHLCADGRLYIEWPTDDSQFWPNLKELSDMGFDCIIGNYFDDPTHKHRIPPTNDIHHALERHGFAIESSGVIRMPLIADELLNHYRQTSDVVSLQLAYWLKTGWIQYMVATPRAALPQDPGQAARDKISNKRPEDFAEYAEILRARRRAQNA